MRLRVLGAFGGTLPGKRMTCFLINDEVVVDAGCMASALTLEEQIRVRHVVLTHSHSDHVNSLPFFIENIFGRIQEPVKIHSLPACIDVVQQHLFNNAIWPDFAAIPDRVLPMMEFRPAPTMATIKMAGLRITMVPVNHVVPTVGVVVEEGDKAIVFSGDTAPTQSLWAVANGLGDGVVRAILLETSFPNRMQPLADISKHLTPQQLLPEIAKCRHVCPVYSYHIKPPYLEEIRAEIEGLEGSGADRLEIVEQDRTYEF